ncbi:MAG: PRC-barrel domain-containing protein [Pseudolabrys sp.]
MLKKLMLGAALSSLALSGALAQSPMSPPSSAPAGTTTPAPAASGRIISSQQPDQWLASKFKGTDVFGSDDQKIGDVSDMLFDKSGKIDAFLVSVGGFLGVGSKEVALPPSSFEVVAGTNGAPDKLKVAMSKDDLKQAQNFTRYQPPRTTTGMAPGGSPAGLPPHPSTNTPPASTK